MSFASLGLSDALVRAVADVGYTDPTPIQLQAIGPILQGRDLLAGAQTGTGKTAAFVLPILQRLAEKPPAHGRRPIRTLILTPTRELAAQVEESVRVYGKHLPLTSSVVFGGVNINPQKAMLARGVDVLVATPGRLLDHHGQKTIDLSHVEVLVLDEADRMLDMGFIHDIKRVLKILPSRRQNLLFSATFSDEIRTLATGLLHDPVSVQVTPRNTTVQAVAQRAMAVEAKRKPDLLIHLVKESNWYQVLVFTRTKHGANKLAAQLVKAGVPALPIHGNKSQNARTRAMTEFKSGKLQVLVATDIAARGIDIEELPHVVNFDLPNVPEDYVHRIGRTGRAGATGEALSFVAPEEEVLLRDIERFTRHKIPRAVTPAFPAATPAPLPAHAVHLQQPAATPARAAQPARGRGTGSQAGRGTGSGRSGAPASRGPRPDERRGERRDTPRGERRAENPDARRSESQADRRPAPQGERRGGASGERSERSHAARGERRDGPSGERRDSAPGAARPPRQGESRSQAPQRRREEPNGVRSLLPPGWPSGEPRRR